MKNLKIIIYLTIKFLLLLVLFCQKFSSCQDALNNSRTNYGLNDDELRAMILGLNYNPSNLNKNSVVDKENTENESFLLRNFINEDIFGSKKNEKDEIEIEDKKSKKRHFDTSRVNTSNKNASLIKNEKKNTSLELKNYQSSHNAIESNKLNEDNQYGDNEENEDNNVFSDSYNLDNTNAFINKNNLNKLNYSSNNKNSDLFNINEPNETNKSNNTELNDLDLYHSNEFNKIKGKNRISDLTNLRKEIDINNTKVAKEINNASDVNSSNETNDINDTNNIQNINNLRKDNRVNKLENLTNNNENLKNISNSNNENQNILKEDNENNFKNKHIFNDVNTINSNHLNNNNINNINDVRTLNRNNSSNNDKETNNIDNIHKVNNKIININDNANNVNRTNNLNNNNTDDINDINNKLNYNREKNSINNVYYSDLNNNNGENDIIVLNNNINEKNSKNINNLDNNNVNYKNNSVVNNNSTYDKNVNYYRSNINNTNNINNRNLSGNASDIFGVNNNLNYINNGVNNTKNKILSDNNINDHNNSNVFNLNNNNENYLGNIKANELNYRNDVNDDLKNNKDENEMKKFNLDNNSGKFTRNININELDYNDRGNNVKGIHNIYDSKMNYVNGENKINLDNNKENYTNNVNDNNLNYSNGVSDINKINDLSNKNINDATGLNKINLTNYNVNDTATNRNNLNKYSKSNLNDVDVSNNNVNVQHGGLLLNDSKKVNNYLEKLDDTNLERSELLQKVRNIKNNESLKVNKLKNEELNNEVNEESSKNINKTMESEVLKDPRKAKLENNYAFTSENGKEYNTEDSYKKINNSGESHNNKYTLHLKNNEKDDLKEEDVDKYLEKNNNINNTLPKSLNFYKIGESDEKLVPFKRENQKTDFRFSGQNSFKNVSDNDEENHIKYSIEDSNGEFNDSKRDILKKINPVKFGEDISNKLYDTSGEEENETLNNIEQNWDNLFSEKITLKKGENDKNQYEYFKLKNNEFKVLGIINKYSPKGGFSISIDCGGYDDFDEIPGISHLLQHVIFYRSQKRSTTLLSELGRYSSEHNCSTNESFTNYFATANSEDIYHLLKLFADNLFYPVFDEEYIENEVREINNEYVSMENNPESCLKIVSEYITDFKYSKFFVYGNYITLCKNVLRNGLNIKKTLYEFHRKCYQPKNMSLSVLLGRKIGSDNHYNMRDIENMVVQIFEKIKNYDYSKEKNIVGKGNHHIEFGDKNFNRRKNHYNTNLAYNDINNNFIRYDGNENGTFIEFINKSNYMLDLNQKSRYIEILKKEGWADQIYLYWSSKINIDLYKKIEEFGSIKFLQEIFSDYKKDGLYYKLIIENKYAYDLKIISTYNKYYLNYGTLIKLTKKGKSNLVHLLHIYNIFIKEITKLFDHDSLDKGLNKYILDYYREKALVTDLNFNNNDINIGLNDLINYSNKLLTYSDDPSLFLIIDKIIEDKDKNDFRNHIKITSLIGSLMKNENLNIINVVDTFTITNINKIPYTTITYAIGENPYLIDEKEIINDINLKLPEIKVCPSSNYGNNTFYEKYFFCVPFSNKENFEYSENQQMFVSQENENILRSNILYNTPCLIKSSYGYNVYFKKGLTNILKVKTDITFYFPSKNFTFYEAIFTRIHTIILKKKIKMFLSDYINCSVNINIRYGTGSYSIHIETNSYFFEELFRKLEEIMSAKEIPSNDEFNEAYNELNIMVQTSTKFGIKNSLKIMHSLFNKYVPTDKEIYDILNSFFFYPSYNAYVRYIHSFLHRNYISIFIYGNLIMPNVKNDENSFNNNKINVDDNSNDYKSVNNTISDNNNNTISDINDNNNINSSIIENSKNNNNNDNNIDNNYTNDKDNNNVNTNLYSIDNSEYKMNENVYNKLDNKNNFSYLKKKQEISETRENFEKKNYESDSLQISFNASGIEYIVNLCESFIRKVTNSVIKRSESTYYTRKLINDEDIEINIQNIGHNTSNSIAVSYMIESETILSDVLINIIADLISSDFIKFIKLRYNDGYIVNVKTFFTPYGLGGLLFVIESFDKNVEKLQADICTFVKYLTFQLLNIEISDLIKKLEIMKESYIINNTIFTFNQEYSSILDQLTFGNECFDKKDKIIKIFDELINCPKIILNKINYILKSSKKVIFKEYKAFNESNNKKEISDNDNINEKCNYYYVKDIKMSNVQLTDNSNLNKTKKLYENKNFLNYDLLEMDELYKKENFINFSNLQIGEKGFFQYIADYFKSGNKKNLKDSNYLDFKSCDEEMSSDNIHVFQNFTDNIKEIREFFLLKFTTDKQIKEKCSVNYEEIRQYCYVHNIDYNESVLK
ncbi:petidase, M16 family, putative [Plasmodium gallinaceum]|uniref:Petidase, M16 family, putative n=1 Tax=Plasmodium gallinaceum TaxID=5849 RepID=A0A1J1GUY1_PLAGA|nr:petidase, M16 family, putative [Plasmodium gallinaceum]CRG96266.1 petidase, M16 family, putative [Plasmodium gallinaceum]